MAGQVYVFECRGDFELVGGLAHSLQFPHRLAQAHLLEVNEVVAKTYTKLFHYDGLYGRVLYFITSNSLHSS